MIIARSRKHSYGIRVTLLSVLLLPLGGCALSGAEEFTDVQTTIEQRTGQTVAWHRDDAEQAAARTRVEAIIAAPLTADGAVEIALLNNRMLQAKYEELGLARADVVQASLLPNPVFDGSYQGTINDGEDPLVEIAVIENIVDLLTIPKRRRIAKEEMAATKADVAREILSLGSEVRAQFYAVQSDEQMLELMRYIVESTAAAFDVANRLRDAGNLTALELAQQKAAWSRAKLDLATSELETLKERERLHILLGLWGNQVNLTIPPRLPEIPSEELDLADIERRAVEASLTLATLRHQILAEGEALGLTKATALIPELDLGAAFSREGDGNRLLGPLLSFPVPLFDQGQPRVRRAQARLNQLLALYYQKGVEVRAVARAARDHLELARERATYMREVELPLANEILNHTQLEYNGMQVGVFHLLEARELEIAAGRRYVEDLRDYWTARTEVEAVLQGHITEFGMQATPLDEVPGSPLH